MVTILCENMHYSQNKEEQQKKKRDRNSTSIFQRIFDTKEPLILLYAIKINGETLTSVDF